MPGLWLDLVYSLDLALLLRLFVKRMAWDDYNYAAITSPGTRSVGKRLRLAFLQRDSIACYAERCISYSKSVHPSVCPSVTRWHCVKTTQAIIMGFSLEDSPMTLASSRLTSPQNSKGNMGSEGADWEWGRKNRQFLANKSPYLRNGAR